MRFINFTASNGAPATAESLEFLNQWQAKQAPPLPADLLAYLTAQARFVVAVARQYQGHGVAWRLLLDAGQQGLIKAWELSRGDAARLDRTSAWCVRQQMLTLIQGNRADTTEIVGQRGNFACLRTEHEVYLYYRGRLIFKKWLHQAPGTSRLFHAGEGQPDIPPQ